MIVGVQCDDRIEGQPTTKYVINGRHGAEF
jgi:hypothetical protein